jgi:hypothetical protein
MGLVSNSVVSGIAAVVLGSGVTLAAVTAASSPTSNVVYACVKGEGQLRIVPSAASCSKSETPLQWNVQGPTGLQGAPGPQGPAGAAGAQGLAGAAGTAGAQGPAGATGAVGSPGAPGAPGIQGPAGPAGPAGKSGVMAADTTFGEWSGEILSCSGTNYLLPTTITLASPARIFVSFASYLDPRDTDPTHVHQSSTKMELLDGSGSVVGASTLVNQRYGVHGGAIVLNGVLRPGYYGLPSDAPFVVPAGTYTLRAVIQTGGAPCAVDEIVEQPTLTYLTLPVN